MWRVIGVVALTACTGNYDHIFTHGAEHAVMCGLTVDNKKTVSNDSIAMFLDRAQAESLIVHLYSHKPAGTVDESTIEQVVGGAADRNMPFATYRDIVDGVATEGLALSFDDHDIDGWHALRPLFDLYGAKVTFFISAFHTLSEAEVAKVRDLASDGHDIEYHSTTHENAEQYAATYGIDQYITDDIVPDVLTMRAAGFDPQVFAYPFGAHTDELDEVLLRDHFRAVRAIHSTCPY